MKKIILLCLLSVLVTYTWAQERVVSGKVTDLGDGSELPGVNVVLKGTTNGTVTDIDGNYRLNVPSEGGVLSFSFVGMQTLDENIGQRSVIDAQMGSDVEQLSEVIVTAQGIERKRESLGFAVSTVDKSALSGRSEGDVARSLRSKASGVQITQQSGTSGSGSNIIIRGYTSMTGNNQPLFIVDGVPFNTASNNTGADGGNSYDFADGQLNGSSRFLDLDPENIESIDILKGFAAATLYGMQGRNGVIMVTTKTGSLSKQNTSNKMSVSVSQSVFANQIASLPKYQNSFGGGFDQVFGWYYSNWGPSFKQTGLAGWGADTSIDDKGSGGYGNLPHPYSQYRNDELLVAFPEYQEGQPGHKYPFKPYDNVKNFFRTGLVYNTSVSARGVSRDGKSAYGLSFGYLNDEGFTPGNNLERMTFSAGGSAKLANRFSIQGTMNLVKTDYTTPPVAISTGNGAYNPRPNSDVPVSSSVFGHVFFTPRSIDMVNLPFEHPITKASTYYRNGNDIQHPLWTVKNAFVSQVNHRMYGNVGATYSITDNLNVAYRVGYDIYSERNESGQHKGGIDGPLTGAYTTFDNVNVIWDHTLSVNGAYKIGDQFGLDFTVGAAARRTTFTQQGASSINQSVYGTFRHFNFTSTSPLQYFEERNILGLYGQVEGNYNGYLFLSLAGRSDEVSNFRKANRSLFYPSVSVSALLSEAFPAMTTPNGLNFFKLRGGFGTSAGFRGGYPTVSTVELDTRSYIGSDGTVIASNATRRALGNPNLRPERQEEIEVGFESRAWDNRITLNLSWYARTATDLIISRPLDPSTGYTSVPANLGKVENTGFEIDLGVDFVRSSQVLWNSRANFTLNKSNVVSVGDDTDKVPTAGFSNLGNFAVKNEPLGIIMGSRIQRTDGGEAIVDATGKYITEEGTFKIGDPNPDFTCNVTNSVSYKNFTFSAVFNWVQGGDMISYTTSALIGRGLTVETEDRLQTFILPGVKNTGTDENPVYTENDIQINNSSFYFAHVAFGPDELQVYDATTIRLQEIGLSYSLPKAVLDKTPFGSFTIAVSGYNLWYKAINMPEGINFDPNVAGLGVGNGQGFDFINGPSSKRYGGSIKFTF